jgi:hypothetical protein
MNILTFDKCISFRTKHRPHRYATRNGHVSNVLSTKQGVTHFRLSRCFVDDIDSALGPLYGVEVGSVADVSIVHAASIFRVK